MYTLKAFRGIATFEQTFKSEEAYLTKLSWLKENGFTIGEIERKSTHVPSSLKVVH